jgi:hypothetical protein
MMKFHDKDAVLRQVEIDLKGRFSVVGDHVFSTLLGASQFISQLGRGDVKPHHLGVGQWVLVREHTPLMFD